MPPYRLVVDHAEHGAELLARCRDSGAFTIEMKRLPAGDYLIGDCILVERKSRTDFLASLIDGRLFSQVARLANSAYRSLMLMEGPTCMGAPDVHPHSVEGALASIAAMWRLPVLHSTDADASCRLLRFLADQAAESAEMGLPRHGRRPKRPATRRLFVLQGLPSVGPATARRLLAQFGSVENVMTADAAMLATIQV